MSLSAFEERRLSSAQRKALRNVRERAREARVKERARLDEILSRSGVRKDVFIEAERHLRQHARVALHFHPDRFTKSGRTVVEGLLADGIYRSQFETGISNGSPTAYRGGERDTWEQHLFGGAYHQADTTPAERPKYGSVCIGRYPDGPSPRFGSCYLVLRPSVSGRCTFTSGDSHSRPEHVGTVDALTSILTAALADIETRGEALGLRGMTPGRFLDFLRHELPRPCDASAVGPPGRVLDDYIEAQAHGTVNLAEDVERLVADPSYRGTAVGEQIAAVCETYGIELQWHGGFVLPAAEVPVDFRGPSIPPLARRIAEVAGTELLDAAAVGVAAAAAHREPEDWREWGAYTDVLRRFRQMWHVLVQFGHQAR